tara:strand:- start:112 stop:912 length:801 start_codon:yes stop_codon:yes gene_type:complete
MKKYILLILSLPLFSFSSNFGQSYTGTYSGQAVSSMDPGTGLNLSYLPTNSVVELNENEKLTVIRVVALLPDSENVVAALDTDGTKRSSTTSMTFVHGIDGASTTSRNVAFSEGLINPASSDSTSRRMRSYGFNFINEYSGVVYDQHSFSFGTFHTNIRTLNHSPDFTIYGPGTIKFYPSVGHLTWIDNPSYIQLSTDITGLDIRVTYVVETVGSDSDDDQSKFSVSLDDDGDRVAVGYKESGSNAVVRVYEYSNGSWEQLGDDVE